MIISLDSAAIATPNPQRSNDCSGDLPGPFAAGPPGPMYVAGQMVGSVGGCFFGPKWAWFHRCFGYVYLENWKDDHPSLVGGFSNMCSFHPENWGNDPICSICFKWVVELPT